MTTGPTPAQVAAQVAMVRRHRPEERVIGIHTPGGWLGGATLQVNGESCTVVYCRSGLQVREALASLEGEGTEPLLIIMTPLDEASSGSTCWRAWPGGSYIVSITGTWCATSFMPARSTHASRHRHGSPRPCYSTSPRVGIHRWRAACWTQRRSGSTFLRNALSCVTVAQTL